MSSTRQPFRPRVETSNTLIGRTSERQNFLQYVLHPKKLTYHVLALWGPAGVGKSTLLHQFQQDARVSRFNHTCLTALVDECTYSPVHIMEQCAIQFRSAGTPLAFFEHMLLRYQNAIQHWSEEQEVAERAFLRQMPKLAQGRKEVPVMGGLYEAVADAARTALWNPPRLFSRIGKNAHPDDLLAELTQAFVEDLSWLAAPIPRSKRGQRIMLFFDELECWAVETNIWLRDQFLPAIFGKNIIVVAASRDPLDYPGLPEQALFSMRLDHFTEDETHAYLNAQGITSAERIATIWHLSAGLPLFVQMLAFDHTADLDPQLDVFANLRHWLDRQDWRKQQLVLHAALFSRHFDQEDLAAFHFLSESERIDLYRWLIGLPFVQHRSLDGLHRYHHLVQQQINQRLFQSSAHDFQVGHRAVADRYWQELERFPRKEGQLFASSTRQLEHIQELVFQWLFLPDEESHMRAIEQVVTMVHAKKQAREIVPLLREFTLEQPAVSANARDTARLLLLYCEADLASQEFLKAVSALIERASHGQKGPQELLAYFYNRRGMAYISRDQLTCAIADFDRVLELDPVSVGALLLRGIAFSGLGEHRRAIADLNHALELDGGNILAYVHRGIAYRELKENKRAIADFDHALGLDPRLEAVSLLRDLTYEQFHKRDRSLADFDHALEQDPNNVQAYILRGIAHCALGEYEQGIRDLDRALALDPNNALAAAGRGHVYLEMGDILRASDDLRRSQALDPGDVDVKFLFEWIELCLDGPQLDTAVHLEAIAAEDPVQYGAYVCRGVALLLRERLEDALAQIEQALLLDRKKGHAYFWKAVTCAFLERDAEAEDALTRAKTAEMPLPEVLFAPLRWLEQKRVDFYR
jgi:tetratricopeptide (TPR) repeat protein